VHCAGEWDPRCPVDIDIGLRVDDIAGLGVRRISVGGAFALAAWNGFMRAAEILKSEGSFSELANVASYAEINGFFAEDLRAGEYRTRAQGAGV
jgi:2-methylisocitrate lyase-like PEP mutase family enzyme